MKKRDEFIKLIQEVVNLIIKFIKPYENHDKVLELPEYIKKTANELGFLSLASIVVTTLCAFMLTVSKYFIENGHVFVGILVFILYQTESIIRRTMDAYKGLKQTKFDEVITGETLLKGSQIIGLTSGKVLKYDEQNKFYFIMSNEEILQTVKNYLINLWLHKFTHKFDICRAIMIIATLVMAVITNTVLPKMWFALSIIIFSIIAFFCSAYDSNSRMNYYQTDRELSKQETTVVNDLLRSPFIVKNDLQMRLSKVRQIVSQSKQNVAKLHLKNNISELLLTVLEVLFNIFIIILYLNRVDNINLGTITEITAMIVIFGNALVQIRRFCSVLYFHNQREIELKAEEKDMLLIMETFYRETQKISSSKKVDKIEINPFSIKYLEASENDKPFTLLSNYPICINNGEIAILYGASGSGKSTFMKMLTDRIKLEKNTEIPQTSRFLFYDEKTKFGNMSIFEELFCGTQNPDLSKMEKILKNLYLWEEIKSNCHDIWKWMQEKKFEISLSNGQKQRLILAKMLYWLDDEIDVVVLDECTSGLDDKLENDSADAEKILEYIIKYINTDKKRITIISTHQNIDGVKKKLFSEYLFKNFVFEKKEDYSEIKKI